MLSRSTLAHPLSRRRVRRHASDLLAAAGAVFDSSLDHRETMRTIAATAVPRLADLCVIDLLGADGRIGDTVVACTRPELGLRLERLRHASPLDPGGEHPVARALREGEAVMVDDPADPGWIERVATHEAHRGLLAEGGYRSGVVMPLRARGHVLGALSLYAGVQRRYDSEGLPLVHDLAARAAMALDNAKLYEERARVAHTLQRSLLPDELPDLDGLALASSYRPAKSGEQVEVGGDFYDVFSSPSGCWLVVGDVCGKGPEAAAVTALVRHSVRALTFIWSSPARVLGVVNEVMLGHGLAGRFATAVLVRLDLDEHPARATLAGAGHPGPLLIDGRGHARVLEPPGMLLGVRPGGGAKDMEVELERGATLVLYTDGLLDAGAPRRASTPAELARALGGAVHGPRRTVAELEQAALRRGEGRLRDDVAIVAAQVL